MSQTGMAFILLATGARHYSKQAFTPHLVRRI
jgi:hypothetical protein